MAVCLLGRKLKALLTGQLILLVNSSLLIMEGYNATANIDKVWSALVPSLVVVSLFLFIVVLVILAALLSLKILHTLWPRPIPVPVPPRTSEIELAETNIETPRVEEAEGGQDDTHQVLLIDQEI